MSPKNGQTRAKLDFIHFLTEEALKMSHLRHGGGVFLMSEAYLDSQKAVKAHGMARFGGIGLVRKWIKSS
jgi:hypothetical protein